MTIQNKIFKTLNISRVSGVPCLYLSNPGVGKTTLIYNYGKSHDYKVTELRGSTSSPEDILGYYVNEGNDSLTIKYPKWFLNIIEDGEKGIPHLLFIDELTTVSKSVQASLLKIIFDREINGIKLPESCIIVSAGNYASTIANSFGLISPIMNRFAIINLMADEDTYIQYVFNKIKEEDNMLFPKDLKNIDSDDIENKIAIYIKKIIRKYSNYNKKEPSIINLNNTDYSAVDNVDGEIYGIMTPRTVSYLSKMTKAAIQLGYTEDLDCIPLGLIGFGTGEVVELDILKGYTAYICSEFKNILQHIKEDGLIVEITNLNQKSDELLKFISDIKSNMKSQIDYISKLNNVKEELILLDNTLQYITSYDKKEVKNCIMKLSNALMHIHNIIHLDKSEDNKIFTKYINGRYNDIHNNIMNVIIKIINGDKIYHIIKNSDEIINVFKEDCLLIK